MNAKAITEKITIWVCGECDFAHSSKLEAELCCKTSPTNEVRKALDRLIAAVEISCLDLHPDSLLRECVHNGRRALEAR